MQEIHANLWFWQAPHPEWNERQDWPQLVSSYALDDGERLVLFDPLAPPPELEARAAERATSIVLTCPWHARDARALAERLGAALYVPPPDVGDPDPVPGEVFRAGDTLELGVRAYEGMEPNDLLLWIESQSALVAGDTLVDRGNGFEFPRDWADRNGDADAILGQLQVLRELPVELVLPTHGSPTDRDALLHALS